MRFKLMLLWHNYRRRRLYSACEYHATLPLCAYSTILSHTYDYTCMNLRVQGMRLADTAVEIDDIFISRSRAFSISAWFRWDEMMTSRHAKAYYQSVYSTVYYFHFGAQCRSARLLPENRISHFTENYDSHFIRMYHIYCLLLSEFHTMSSSRCVAFQYLQCLFYHIVDDAFIFIFI